MPRGRPDRASSSSAAPWNHSSPTGGVRRAPRQRWTDASVPISVDLSARRVLGTGASSGMGEVTCRAGILGEASGAMLARRDDRLAALTVDLGERVIGIACDVTDLVVLT